MLSRTFSLSRTAFAALLLCLPATAGWARGDAGAPVTPRALETAAAPAVADQLDALLTARFAAAGSVPAPEARRQALQMLSQFAAMTVEGLIEAAANGEMRMQMDERLRPILDRHQANIAAALAAGERPSAPGRAPLARTGDF
jgi:hypothetical protein